jgi:hypothetical protein
MSPIRQGNNLTQAVLGVVWVAAWRGHAARKHQLHKICPIIRQSSDGEVDAGRAFGNETEPMAVTARRRDGPTRGTNSRADPSSVIPQVAHALDETSAAPQVARRGHAST